MPASKGMLEIRGRPGPLLRLLAGSQVLVLAANLLLAPGACAQGLSTGSQVNTINGAGSPTIAGATSSLLSQVPPVGAPRATQGTILPTDVVPLPAAQERMSFGENLQLRVLQRLPARLYFNASVENSFRYETNVFQFPTKRAFLRQIFATTPPPIFARLPVPLQQQIRDQTLRLSSRDDQVFRCLPNLTAGWTITPRTRIFGNYFMIRDSLFHNIRLNTVIHSLAYGIQQDIPITRRGNLQLEFQARELYQLHQQPLFDFLPALTFSYILTPRTVLFANTLLQLRGKRYFQAPTREIDPFYTFGFMHQRGGWSFSNTATFVQNFREPFRQNATIPVNNYSWILDFEVARRLIKQLPGLQVFIRAEPIYNFKAHNRPGLAGMDFRLFWGMRFALGKPALTAALEQIRQQLEEQEAPPPTVPPGKQPAEPKPSAFLMPYQLIAGSPQPIHGPLTPIVSHHTHDGLDAPVLAVLHGSKDPVSHEGPLSYVPMAPESALLAVAKPQPGSQTLCPAVVLPPAQSEAAESLSVSLPKGKHPRRQLESAHAHSHQMTLVTAPDQSPKKKIPEEPSGAPADAASNRHAGAGTQISLLPEPASASTVVEEAEPRLPAQSLPESVPAPGAEDEAESSAPAAGTSDRHLPVSAYEPATEAISVSPGSLRGSRLERETTIVPAAADAGSAGQSPVTAAPELRGPLSVEQAKPGRNAARKKRSAVPPGVVKPAGQASRQVRMVLIPPLPRVDVESKENPFRDAGVELNRPIMMNIVH